MPRVKEMVNETIILGGREIELVPMAIELAQVSLDEANPRIQFSLSQEVNGRTIEEIILSIPQVRVLRGAIEANGGLKERILVQQGTPKRGRGAASYVVREGNCRLVCYKSLHAKEPDDPRWGAIPALLLPSDITEQEITSLLLDVHVGQKIPWNAHERAGYVYRAVKSLAMTEEDARIAARKPSLAALRKLMGAYQLMSEVFLTIDKGKYAINGEHKWAFFEEAFRHKGLVARLADPEFATIFCRLVGDGVLPAATAVRNLEPILEIPEAADTLTEGNYEAAVEIVRAAHPEAASDFFQMIDRMTATKASIDELMLIKTDPAAREKLEGLMRKLEAFYAMALGEQATHKPPGASKSASGALSFGKSTAA